MMSRSINSHSSQQLYQQGSPINTSFSFGSVGSSSGNGNSNCTSTTTTTNGNANGYTSPVLARAHPRRGSSFRANANVNLLNTSSSNNNTQQQHVGGSVSPLYHFQNSLSHSNSIHSQHSNNNTSSNNNNNNNTNSSSTTTTTTTTAIPNKKFTLDVTSQSSDSELENDVSSSQLSFDAAINQSQSQSHHNNNNNNNNNNNRSNSTHSVSASTSSVPKSALVGLSRKSSVQMGSSGSAAGRANSLIDDVVQRNSSEDEASFITVGDGLGTFRG
ncbi:unnamed protein product [Ambrosiozyma monospora]|uniref:Unnamed protein product n=1 Tax=Ambrosiozyma monospora TaxID=43982 RepID=A0A9W6WLZ6_AMBMO|nr:unnamed protein product [Ambrosiozyma monospora]